MSERTTSSARKPKVNKRDVNFNEGKEIALEDQKHNPSKDSIHLTGYERSIGEYNEIAVSWLKKESAISP